MRVQAIFNGTVVAASDRTVIVEGNHYFPVDDVVVSPPGTGGTPTGRFDWVTILIGIPKGSSPSRGVRRWAREVLPLRASPVPGWSRRSVLESAV